MMIYFGQIPLGRRIRAARRRQRLSPKKVSALTGIPLPMLLGLEWGFLRDIHHDHLLALCRVLRITGDELLAKPEK